MSWSDDIRCLYCDGKLPLYRKITNGQFCSTAHRKLYWQQQEELAVERLHQTHNSLRAWQSPKLEMEPQPPPPPAPASVPETIEPPQVWTAFESRPAPSADDSPELIAADPFEYELLRAPETPTLAFPPFSQRLLTAGEVPVDARPLACEAHAYAALKSVAPIERTVEPVRHAVLNAKPETDELSTVLEDSEPCSAPPYVDRLLPVESPVARGSDPGPIARDLEAKPVSLIPEMPAARGTRTEFGLLAMAGFRRLDFRADAQRQIVPPLANPTSLELSVAVSKKVSRVVGLKAEPRIAAGCRYSFSERGRKAPEPQPSRLELVSKPMRPAAPSLELPAETEPKFGAVSSLAPLPYRPEARHWPTGLKEFVIPQPFTTARMLPGLRVEPATAPAEGPSGSRESEMVKATRGKLPPWAHARGFWKYAPRDLKVLLFAIPLLLALALHPSLPKVQVNAPDGNGFQSGAQRIWNEQMVAMRQTLTDRAGVELDEDFRTGLDDWTSQGQAATEWSFDSTGFVQPTTLALYEPSLSLTDYQMQFLGMIDKRALSWVVRAADFSNYYVVKLVVVKDGPVPTIGVTRYAVINGKATSRGDVLALIDARQDTLYRVRLDVHDDTYALAVQGQMIDTWSEPRLKRGGVGFFCGKGEASRIRWLQVTHQYDMLGRLCAYLAPYNPSMNGSWQ